MTPAVTCQASIQVHLNYKAAFARANSDDRSVPTAHNHFAHLCPMATFVQTFAPDVNLGKDVEIEVPPLYGCDNWDETRLAPCRVQKPCPSGKALQKFPVTP